MNWSDERYIKLYTRDTAEWLGLAWQARALFPLLLRKCDRSGLVAVRPGPRRVGLLAGLVALPVEVVEPGIADLLADGCVAEDKDGYRIPNFAEAQETRDSNAQRQRRWRDRNAALRDVTDGNAIARQNVTKSNTASHVVTPRLEQTRTEENRKEKETLSLEMQSVEKKPRKLSDAEKFFAWAQEKRLEALPKAIPETIESVCSGLPELRAWFERAMAERNVSLEALRQAWKAWLADEWALRTCEPQCSFRAFKSDKIWRRKASGQPAQLAANDNIEYTPELLAEIRRKYGRDLRPGERITPGGHIELPDGTWTPWEGEDIQVAGWKL